MSACQYDKVTKSLRPPKQFQDQTTMSQHTILTNVSILEARAKICENFIEYVIVLYETSACSTAHLKTSRNHN